MDEMEPSECMYPNDIGILEGDAWNFARHLYRIAETFTNVQATLPKVVTGLVLAKPKLCLKVETGTSKS